MVARFGKMWCPGWVGGKGHDRCYLGAGDDDDDDDDDDEKAFPYYILPMFNKD